MKEFEIKERYDMDDYRALMHFLRGPEGCPWDRVQTHESIRRNVIEEAYETAHAIDTGDRENLREELGDLLMQVLFHTDMEEAEGGFTLDDVADTACKKLVFRHPHVFGTASADDPEAVLTTWDEQKRAEKGQSTVTETLVSVAENLPALWRAEKIQKKAEAADFDLTDVRERGERALSAGEIPDADDPASAERVIGDLLFAAVSAARARKIDPETALHGACARFIERFAAQEGRK